MQAFELACTKKAFDPTLLDLTELCSYADYLLLLSGRSLRQVAAIAEAIEVGMKGKGHDAIGREGARGGQWILLDYGDLVVHVFYEPVRGYYDLEGLWVDAKRTDLEEPPAPRSAAGG
jgi:ribosome-associated protein